MKEVKLKNITVKGLEREINKYSKMYDSVTLKYNFRKKTAILTLTSRCKLK